jgi:hypothetical protein
VHLYLVLEVQNQRMMMRRAMISLFSRRVSERRAANHEASLICVSFPQRRKTQNDGVD